ncbi:MAG: GntR family transcriptional regulator [Marmoricola sp.]
MTLENRAGSAADEDGARQQRRGRKHVLVREYVRSLVLASEPGSPAPSERDLAEQFGVARMTVRHAIDALVAQGLVERVAGKGTFVARPQIDLQMRLSSYTEEMERRGKRPTSKTLMLRPEKAGPGVARALELEEGAPIVHWQRLRLADGEPMAIQHAYLSLEQFPRFLDDPAPDSLYFWLTDRELMPTWGEDSVSGAVATTDESETLGLAPGAAVLHISRRSFCRDVAIEVTRSVYRADRYTLWVPVLRPEHLR